MADNLLEVYRTKLSFKVVNGFRMALVMNPWIVENLESLCYRTSIMCRRSFLAANAISLFGAPE
jgi:hypothetical protein